MLSKEAQREKAHEIAERAMSDIKDTLSEGHMLELFEPGYDLIEHENGWIEIKASHDVRLFVDPDGEEAYDLPRSEPTEAELERRAENVGVPFWRQV